jgi:hypothetical protein
VTGRDKIVPVLVVSNLDFFLGPFPIFFVSVYPIAGLYAVVYAVRVTFLAWPLP